MYRNNALHCSKISSSVYACLQCLCLSVCLITAAETRTTMNKRQRPQTFHTPASAPLKVHRSEVNHYLLRILLYAQPWTSWTALLYRGPRLSFILMRGPQAFSFETAIFGPSK